MPTWRGFGTHHGASRGTPSGDRDSPLQRVRIILANLQIGLVPLSHRMNWNLRRVQVTRKTHPHLATFVVEVYYDVENQPADYADASLLTKIRLWRDWFRTPVLRYPEDFTGSLVSDETTKWLAKMREEGWHSLTYEEIEKMRREESPTMIERIEDWIGRKRK